MYAYKNLWLKYVKITALMLINSFLCLDFTVAGPDFFTLKPKDCLSPNIQITNPQIIDNFKISQDLLNQELQEAAKTIHYRNLAKSKVRKNAVVNTIQENIFNGLALSLNLETAPTNFDKWFSGTNEQIAEKFIKGFNFEKIPSLENRAKSGLAEYFKHLDIPGKNILKLKLEQLIRNTKRSIKDEQRKDLRLVVLLGQNDVFSQRKVLGYSGESSIYLHVNTLMLTEIEAEKNALGLMLEYQANLIQSIRKKTKPKKITKTQKQSINGLWQKKILLTQAEKDKEAKRLKAQTIKEYSKHNWMQWFKMPFNLHNYLVPWTQMSRDMGKSFRDNIFFPQLSFWSWMSPRRFPVGPFENFFNIPAMMLRFLGFFADQTQRTIQWLQEVEVKDTDWGMEFKVVKEKKNSYRLLEFIDPRYKTEEKLTPIFVVNPNAGHDSTVGKDIVDIFLRKGHRVFAFDWQSADPGKVELISDLIANVTDCINHIDGSVQVAALCQGGWVSAATLALLASFQPEKVEAAYMAAVPFYATLGDNAITETVKNMPEWFFHLLVFWLGITGVQDGSHQMGGFENMGDPFYKQVGYWLELISNIDNTKELARAEEFIKWYYNKFLNLSLWYLEGVIRHFRDNDIYEGRYRTQVGHEMRTVDLSKITIPLILLSGTKDDVTAPGTVLKKDLAQVLSDGKNLDIQNIWDFLVAEKFISDTGEGEINRKKGQKAVLEQKILEMSLKEFLKINDPILKNMTSAGLIKLFLFLKEECYGQCRALKNVVGSEDVLEFIMNRGHTGVFKSEKPQSETRVRWRQSREWVNAKVAVNKDKKEKQRLKNLAADQARILETEHKQKILQASDKLKLSFGPMSVSNIDFIPSAI